MRDLSVLISVCNVRAASASADVRLYVGRGRAPAGWTLPEEGSLGNPLPVLGKGRWTPATDTAIQVILHEKPELQLATQQAQHRGGFEHGQAAQLYLTYLRGCCRQGQSLERRILHRIAQHLIDGQTVQLGCWCKPRGCHGDAIRLAGIGYAQQFSAMSCSP